MGRATTIGGKGSVGSSAAPGGFGTTPGATDQVIVPAQWFGLDGAGQFNFAVPLATVMQELANNSYTIPSALIGAQAVQATHMAQNAVTAANGALAAAAVVDSNIASMNISKLVAGTVIFTGDVYMSRGTGLPEIGLTYAALTLYSQAGSTSVPYVQIEGTGALFSAGGSGASVLMSGNAISLYSANGSTSVPYVTLTSSVIGLYSGGNFSATLSSSLFQMLYGSTAATTLTPLGLITQNGQYATYTASTGFWAGMSATNFPIVTAGNYASVVSQMASSNTYVLIGTPGSSFEIDLVNGTNKVLVQTTAITMLYGSGASLVLGYNSVLGLYGLTIYSVNGSMASPYATFTSTGIVLQYNSSNSFQVNSGGVTFTSNGTSASLEYLSGFGAVAMVAPMFVDYSYNTSLTAVALTMNVGTLKFGPANSNWYASASASLAGYLGIYIGGSLVKIPCYSA